MTNARLYSTIAVLVLVSSLLPIEIASQIPGPGSQNSSSISANKRDAEKAWDSLIRAKGGREKLESLRSMLTQDDRRLPETSLYVFPDLVWEFQYYPVGPPKVDVYDGWIKTWYFPGGLQPALQIDRTDDVMMEQLVFLLETRNYKPQLLRVKRVPLEKEKVDVIETIVGTSQLDFVYEPEEMLVSEIWFHNKRGEIFQKYRFFDYVDVDGIKMPSSWSFDQAFNKFAFLKVKRPIRFQFNVDYDPKIFEPPFSAATPDAWKRKP